MTDEAKLKTTIIDAMVAVGALTPEQGLEYANSGEDFSFQSLVLDSLAVMDFCFELEAKLGLAIEPSDMLEVANCHDLVALLGRRTGN